MSQKLFCTSGGCTAKLGAGALSRVLGMLKRGEDDRLLVGFDSHDDAAVYRINDGQAIVSTLDFFPPMVEDPYLFGQIAAANALSDIYAMGGRPLTALNIVCFPEDQDLNLLGRILDGGNDKVLEADALLVGGHSIADAGIKYGLSVTGIVHPDAIYHNNTCQAGDALILTKPLGVGIICAANRVGAASASAMQAATDSMKTLNRWAAQVLGNYPVHACSDVTGFGFLVHLSEMLDGRFSAEIDGESVPRFEQCAAYAEEFYLTAAGQKNRNFMDGNVRFERDDFALEEILFDPQTSGGLLVSVPEEAAREIVARMREEGIPAAKVGRVIPRTEWTVTVQ